MLENNFGVHPSARLNEAYNKKYWQGQNPNHAKVIFLGLDANWDINIETNDTGIFEEILEYLDDGVVYWQKNNYHHPFLSPGYNRGDGYAYHSRFLKTDIKSKYADKVSFVELLSMPTFGMSSKSARLFNDLIDVDHLRKLDDIIFNQTSKIVFMPKSVYEKVRSIKKKLRIDSIFNFDTDLERGINYGNKLMNIHNCRGVSIFVHTHFSNAISNLHLKNIGLVAKTFMDDSEEKHWWRINFIDQNKGETTTKYICARNVMEVNKIININADRIPNIKQLEYEHVQENEVDCNQILK